MSEPLNCKCEPCGFDIRSLGFVTRKEDPAFEGTQCLWHEVISGAGSNQPTIGLNAVADDGTPTFYMSDLGSSPAEKFELRDLPKYAKLIKAKRSM